MLRPAIVSFMLVATGATAQPACKRPTPVGSVSDIKSHYLAVKSSFHPAVIDSDCVLLNPRTFKGPVQFLIIPPKREGSDAAYVFIKSYRVFNAEPPDKIKMSRSDGWFFPAGTPAAFGDADRKDDVAYDGSAEDWNREHSSPGTPQEMETRLKFRWHAYAGKDDVSSSNRRSSHWKARSDFDFSRGTLTNYLIRFPADSSTPIPFSVGLLPQVKEFRLEIYSSVDEIAGTYQFVRK
jgi:hypothetical protein